MEKIKLHNNTEKLDKAWGHLYNRLEKEKLLDEKQRKYDTGHDMVMWLSIAALFIMVCSVGFWIMNRDDMDQTSDAALLTLQNQEISILATTLQDGSIVLLQQDASLLFPESFDADKREITFSGEACFDIAKNERAPFIINTPNASVKVLGTVFNIETHQP